MRHDAHHPATSPALDRYPLRAQNILSYSLPSVTEEIALSRFSTIGYVNLPPQKSGGKWGVNGGYSGGKRECFGGKPTPNQPLPRQNITPTSSLRSPSRCAFVISASSWIRHCYFCYSAFIGHCVLVIGHFRFVMATTTICYPLAIPIVTTQPARGYPALDATPGSPGVARTRLHRSLILLTWPRKSCPSAFCLSNFSRSEQASLIWEKPKPPVAPLS